MKFIIDNKIPFISGRLESHGETIYLPPSEIKREAVKDADALIIRTRTKCDATLLKGSTVKFIATATIGTDHIDLDWCRENGITVRNAAGCNAPGVAQYVWSALLRSGVRAGESVIGIIGVGNVGSIVADWGKRLGFRVLLCDPLRKEAGFTDHDYIPLEEVLKESDAVTLHTPLTRSGDYPTYHLIGEKELGMMKPDAILINSSRGPVVDNSAWVSDLRKGKGRAFIDVWEGEPEISSDLPALADIATPHIAGYSFEGKQRATRMALEATGEYFGFSPDITGLCSPYQMPERDFTDSDASLIMKSYDPEEDSARLRANPCDFEKLRSDYNYRHEPEFSALKRYGN